MNSRSIILGVLLTLFAALQLLPGAGVREADARVFGGNGVDYPCYVSSYNSYPATCTHQAAWEQCGQVVAWGKTHGYPSAVCAVILEGAVNGSFKARLSSSNEVTYFNYGGGCPAGKVWDDASKTCFDSAACLAKPVVPLGVLNINVSGVKFCHEGCEFEAKNGTQSAMTLGAGGEALNTYTGGAYTPSGAPCVSGEGDYGQDTPQECMPIEGLTMCKRNDGKLCATSSPGKHICWTAGETGEKGDGAMLQVRSAGALPATPQTPPPAGDTFTQQGGAVKATESVNNGPTITTNIANYSTGSGANAVPGSGSTATGGSGSAGEPADGSTSGSGGTGDSDAERNSLLGEIKDKLDSLKSAMFGDGSDPNADTTGTTGVAGDVMSDSEVGGDGFDESGFGYSRVCPAPPTVDVLGHTFTFDAEGHFCDWMVAGGWFVLIVAGIASMYIAVGGSRR